jgi:hypothetical protein
VGDDRMLLVLFDGHARDTKACAIDGGTEGQSSPARPSAASEDEAPLMANVAALAEAIWPKHLLPDRPQDAQQHSRRKFELRLRGPHEHAGHFVSDHWSGMQTHFSTASVGTPSGRISGCVANRAVTVKAVGTCSVWLSAENLPGKWPLDGRQAHLHVCRRLDLAVGLVAVPTFSLVRAALLAVPMSSLGLMPYSTNGSRRLSLCRRYSGLLAIGTLPVPVLSTRAGAYLGSGEGGGGPGLEMLLLSVAAVAVPSFFVW